MKPTETVDAVVIGAGPSGCACAIILAQQGRRVLVLERETFPRYHIGESLIPFTYPALERLGLIPKLRASSFTKKYSVQFVAPSGRASQPFYFFNRYDRDSIAQTWQVLRSEFDSMVLDHTREQGVEVREASEVVEFLKEGDRVVGVTVRGPGEMTYDVRAAITVDATGREAMAATRHAWRRGDPKLNKVAVWTYYEGALRDEGIDAGATTVAFIPGKGWFWYIPQHNNRVSVGVVADGKYLCRDGVKDPKTILQREIPQNKWIESHLASGTCTEEYWLTAEYTFRSEYCATDGLLLIGDAYGFLDPVFSSGLMLAFKSGVLAGDAIHQALSTGDCSANQFESYSRVMHEGMENMRKLVYAFYDPNVSFRTLTDDHPHLQGPLTDCLSGDVNRDFSELFEAFSKYTTLPDVLPYGFPKHSSQALRNPVSSALPSVAARG
jgi:flavin-dependent dehydrogenase